MSGPAPSEAPLRPARLWRGRLRRWIGIFSAYFTAQTLVQLLGIATGLLLIRTMEIREFSLYTLAFSVVTFFTFLTDLGSTGSLLHFHQRSAAEGTDFAPYFAAVLSLRRRAFLLGAAIVVVVFPLLASAEGFSWTATALVTAGILVHVWFQIRSSIRLLSLRLRDRYPQSYRAEVGGTGLRLLLACLMVATQQLAAWLGVAATAAGSALSARLAKSRDDLEARAGGAGAAGEDLAPYRRRVVRYLLPTLPSALYFSVQGPLVIWLAATFGNTRSIAEVGALGRLALVVGLLSGLTGVVFLPRLAAMSDERLFRRRSFQFGLLLAALAGGLLAAAAVAPKLFLLLLGPRYGGLHRELLLTLAGSGLALLGSYFASVVFARGWIRFQGWTLAGELLGQIVFLRLLDLSTSAGVLRFTLLNAAVALALQVATLAVGFRRPEWVRWGYA